MGYAKKMVLVPQETLTKLQSARRLEQTPTTRTASYLHVLVKGTCKQRQGIIQGANKELVKCMCECALNVLNGNVPLKPADKKKLKKYRHNLRSLAKKKRAPRRKRKFSIKRVDFFGLYLLPC